MLQTQTVTADTLALTKQLMADPRLNNFILVGGTALALTIGHRQSIDIDLFTQPPFDASAIADVLQKDYQAENIKTLKNSVFCSIDGVKTDLIAHPYLEVEKHKEIEGIRISSLLDIAAMKLHAIVQNSTRKKDYIDIYFLLKKMPLSKMYSAYEEKYFPNSSRAVARIFLNDITKVNEKDEIMLSGRSVEWPRQVKERLTLAIEFYDKIFSAPAQHQATKETQSQKKSRGQRH